MKRTDLFVLSAVVLLLGYVFAARMVRSQRAEHVTTMATDDRLVPAHAVTLGPSNAPVTLVEFFDPGCETCAEFHYHVQVLMAEHPAQIRLVLRYAPFHQGADKAVKILEASRKQGKYWQTLDLLFDTQPQWADHHQPRPEVLWQFLPRVGLDIAKMRVDVADPQLDALIARDLADAEALGIRKTPGFLVNGKPLQRFGVMQLRGLVEQELAASR